MHCLYGGYNLHRFSDALGLVIGCTCLGWLTNLQEIMDSGSSGVARFDLGHLQGQTRIAKPKSAYNSLIIGPSGLGW